MDRQDLRDAWQYVLLIAPAPIGALIGLRYAVEQSARARALSWLCSCGIGISAGPWLGELLNLTASGVSVATIVAAAVGMEVIAGVNAAARAFAADPLGFLAKAFSIFRRGGP